MVVLEVVDIECLLRLKTAKQNKKNLQCALKTVYFLVYSQFFDFYTPRYSNQPRIDFI